MTHKMTPAIWLSQFYDTITGPVGPDGRYTAMRADVIRVIEASDGTFDVALILERNKSAEEAKNGAEAAKDGLRKIIDDIAPTPLSYMKDQVSTSHL